MTTAPRRTVQLSGDAAENLRWCAYEAMHNTLELAEDRNGVSMDGFQTIIDLRGRVAHRPPDVLLLEGRPSRCSSPCCGSSPTPYAPADSDGISPELREALTHFEYRVARALADLQAGQSD